MNNLAILLSEEELEEKTKLMVREEVEKILKAGETAKKNNLSVDEAVAFLNSIGYKIAKSQLYKLTMSNEIACSKFGRRVVFDSEELKAWVESKKQKRVDIAGNVSRSANNKIMEVK